MTLLSCHFRNIRRGILFISGYSGLHKCSSPLTVYTTGPQVPSNFSKPFRLLPSPSSDEQQQKSVIANNKIISFHVCFLLLIKHLKHLLCRSRTICHLRFHLWQCSPQPQQCHHLPLSFRVVLCYLLARNLLFITDIHPNSVFVMWIGF